MDITSKDIEQCSSLKEAQELFSKLLEGSRTRKFESIALEVDLLLKVQELRQDECV